MTLKTKKKGGKASCYRVSEAEDRPSLELMEALQRHERLTLSKRFNEGYQTISSKAFSTIFWSD